MFYTDSKQSSGSAAYYPVNMGGATNANIALQDLYFNSSKKFIMSILGLRWEDRWDLRFEYLSNSAGYDKLQMENFPLAFYPVNPYAQANANILSQMHMPFMRQNYLYFSGRSPAFGAKKKYHFNFNIIKNDDDYSVLNIAKLEQDVGDSGTLIYSIAQANGDRAAGEYSNYIKDYISVLFKWIF